MRTAILLTVALAGAPDTSELTRPCGGDASCEAQRLDAAGQALAQRSRDEESEALLRLALDAWKRAGSPSAGIAGTLSNLGYVLNRLGDRAGALRSYEDALTRRRALQDADGEGLVLNNMGGVHADAGQHAEALARYAEALDAYRRAGSRRGQAHVLNLMGISSAALGRPGQALEHYLRALELADGAEEARTLGHLADLYLQRGDRAKAIAHAERALAVLAKHPDRRVEAGALTTLGVARTGLDPEHALADLAKAFELFQALSDPRGMAKVVHNVARVYQDMGQRAVARDGFEEALRLWDAGRWPPGKASTLTALGLLYEQLGELEAAVGTYRQALEIHREFRNLTGQIAVLNNLGVAHLKAGRPREALPFLDEALELAQATASRQAEAIVRGSLGEVRAALGDHRGALEAHQAALPLRRETADRAGEARTLNNIGLAELRLGDRRKALDHLEEALAVATGVGDRELQARGLTNLAAVVREGAPGRAVLHAKQASDLMGSLRADLRGLSPESQRDFARTVSDTHRLLAALLVSRGRIAEAIGELMALKADELDLLALHPGSARPRVPRSRPEVTAEARYDAAARRLAAAAAEHDALLVADRPGDAARLRELAARVESERKAFRRTLAEVGAELGGGTSKAEVGRDVVRRTLDGLGGDAAAVLTLADHERVIAILVTRGEARSYEAAVPAAELWRRVSALRTALSTARGDARAAGGSVHDAVLGATASGGGGRTLGADLLASKAATVLWSLDGALRYVPVASLHDGERWLVERYRSVVMTAAPGAGSASERRKPWVVGFGVTKGREGLRPLQSQDELAFIHANDGDGGVLDGRPLLDEQFTKDAMIRELAARPTIVHVASHYVLRPPAPTGEDRSYLLLGDGEHLTLRDWDELPAEALRDLHLLTLSACETGLGQFSAPMDALGGAEVDGVSALVLARGARAVLATLWRVSDRSAVDLMNRFYRARRGEDLIAAATALQSVQKAFLPGGSAAAPAPAVLPAAQKLTHRTGAADDSDQSFVDDPTHPSYWAPFVLMGRWGALTNASPAASPSKAR